MAGPGNPTGPQSPGQGGTIDVKPSDLFRVSGGVAAQQTPMDKGAKDLLEKLKEYPDAGGYGTAPQAFAASYVKVGNRFLEVWARSVVSIGGAAVGFTTTANNYAKAEAANDPTGKTKATTQQPPQVIEKAPDYGSVPNLKWGDDDGGDDFLRSVLEWVPEPVREVLRPIVKHAFRMGKVAEVYPYPQQHYLNSLSQAWMMTTSALSMAESGLTGNVSSITQQSNSEWHDAMRSFCSSLWGTTAWGKNNTAGYRWKHDSANSQTATHPVMTVLFDTATKVGDLLYEFAEAAVYINREVWEVYKEAIRDAIPKVEVNLKDGVGMDDVKGLIKGVVKGVAKGASQLGAGIVLNLDTAKLNAIVTEYNRRVNALIPRMDALKEPLDEAYLSAPTFRAESARAEAFGARALNDFKREHVWTVPGADASAHKYPIDLANQEHMGNSHAIDRHVGKSDDQLAQRLRDQSNIPAASSFTNLDDAQKYTQLTLDKKKADIEAYLNSGPPWHPPTKTFVYEDQNLTTGRTLSKSDYLNDPQNPNVQDSHGVQIRIKPDPETDPAKRLDPPFTIITSTPN
ncbi:hypothetical protein H9Y04_32520 [Streptomyces sp. TRM66268-LWL]|uniref:Bacterial CdiA-CT RNAse A domain-containing protein n=1 Tax=Streptomyces polyasparticus TaxID=2767826 RepID=A0ABR7SP55_9ACTN|nr:RNase A-like domain-containing protein [Streptomyces polyasparticus]MBC9717262.1 hypothetical protein [Streptomyces polyasparticus]